MDNVDEPNAEKSSCSIEKIILTDLEGIVHSGKLFSSEISQRLHEIYVPTNDAESKFFQIERGGFLTLDPETLFVSNFELFKHGDSARFIYPHYSPFVFHCHPKSRHVGLTLQPPSGVDIANSLLWGGVDNFDHEKIKDTITYLDCVLAEEGIWIVLKTWDLYSYLLDLAKTDTQNRLESLYYFIEWYSFVLNVMLQNGLIGINEYCKWHRKIDVPFLLEILDKNEPFTKYIETIQANKSTAELCTLTIKEVKTLLSDPLEPKYKEIASKLAAMNALNITLLPW